MSDKSKEATEVIEQVTPAPQVAPAPTFTIERLRRDCLTLFGVTPSTYNGATHGLQGDYTVDDMRARIAKWQNQQVRLKPKKNAKKEVKS